jgi:hypothetical protein
MTASQCRGRFINTNDEETKRWNESLALFSWFRPKGALDIDD